MKNYWDKLIKKYDKKRYAPIYKAMTEQLFQSITDQIFEYSWNKIRGIEALHIEDIEYLDGYYIFPMGTNTVVHFKVKECPGWLFGIWWNEPKCEDKKSKTFIMKGTFFTQYEKIIDKFKPSDSTITAEVQARICKKSKSTEDNVWHITDSYDMTNQIRFIIKEPELAFCRSYSGWDYNVQYHDKRSAKKQFEHWKTWDENKEKYSKVCNDKILDFVKNKIMPRYGNAELIDRGSCWSPRYQIACKLSECIGKITGPGYWDLEWDGEDSDLDKEWNKLQEECKAISDKYKFIWFSPVSGNCLVVDDANWEQYKELAQDEE